jgi:hypothetical protein
MTEQEWLTQVDSAKDKLRYLLQHYHPAQIHQKKYEKLPITANNAEQACEVVRDKIRKNWEGDPVKEFQDALDMRDCVKIYKLLGDAWFGVPESTSCWNITGFKEAVDLMDDPPESIE